MRLHPRLAAGITTLIMVFLGMIIVLIVYEIFDFSDYAEEVTGEALFKINGGEQVENSIMKYAE